MPRPRRSGSILHAWVIALVASPPATGSISPASSDALVRLPNGQDLEVSMQDGHCMKTPGPFVDWVSEDPEEASDAVVVQMLGAWTGRDHLLCTLSSDAEVTEASLTVSPAKPIEGSKGDFGFGHKVLVDLRPRVQTSAVWPLQASVPSLAIPFRGQAARVIALRTIVENELSENPIVATHSRFGWPIDVQLVNESMGVCQPENIPGARRMACRLKADAVGLVRVVVFCGPCRSGHATLQVGKGSEFARSTTSPWLGLSAPVRKVQQWAVTVTDEKGRSEFIVAIARGDAQVAWQESTAQRRARLIGWVLAQATMVTVAATVMACAAAATGRPAAPLAAAPGLTAAAATLPFLAQLAGRQDAPSLLQSGFGPLAIFCAPPYAILLVAATAVAFVVVAHCAAVAQFLAANGPGAAEHIPHCLSFGGLELRSLPYFALPVSAAATQILLSAYDEGFNRFFNVLSGLFGAFLLLSLLVAAWKVTRTLREWFTELRVICLQHPKSGQLQYVDRVCDQLCALPFVPGETRLLGDWPSSPSFRFSPTVASIFAVEHTGAAKTRGQPWDRTWSMGPWTDFLARQPSSPQLPRSSSNNTLNSLRHRGISLDSGAENPLVQNRAASRKYSSEAPPSSLMGAHPVVVRTQFVYADSGNELSIAGVAGLSWLDAVVPAQALASIEDCIGRVQLRVQACQLSGPHTSGVLAACFDQSDRTPWRWPQDLLTKVLLGILVALAPAASADRRLEQGFWLLCVVVVVAWVPWTVPHAHLLDNIAAATAAASLPLGGAFYFSGQQLPDVDDILVYATLAGGFFPVILSLVAALLTLSTAFAPRCTEETHDQALQQVVAGWGEISGTRIGSSSSGYQNLQEEDDSPPRVRVAPAEAAAIHSADLVLLPPQNIDAETAKASRPRIPCEVKSPIQQTHLWMKGPVAVSSTLMERRPQLALPAELLLGAPELGSFGLPTACPLATVLTPNSGILLYSDKDLNGGVPWQEALQTFLADVPPLLKEARKALLGLEEKDFQGSSCLVSLEILE